MATVQFGPLEIAFAEGVLEPRQWTIGQSHWAIELSHGLADGPVLELCAGAGQIGLVVALETGRLLVQVDDHEEACTFARHNADAAGIVSDVRCAPIDAAVEPDERFPLVLADPPYVPSDATDAYDDDPAHAIDGGPDGLDVARRCIAVARGALAPGGALLVQTGGPDQAETLAAEAAFAHHEIRTFAPDRALLLGFW